MSQVSIKFWGVRGSSAGTASRIGGNTPCIEIRSGTELIICDAGTGCRNLGRSLALSKKPVKATILLSHVHWDHIEGLPFFVPLYSKKNAFDIIGPKSHGMPLKKALHTALAEPFFPVALANVPSRVKIIEASKRPIKLKGMTISHFPLNHPGGALGWRFEFKGGRTLVYISDNEPAKDNARLLEELKGADILIHDAQYTEGDYKLKKGWGHSPVSYPAYLAKEAGVKLLILNHFDPSHTDKQIMANLKIVRRILRGSSTTCMLAREGLTL